MLKKFLLRVFFLIFAKSDDRVRFYVKGIYFCKHHNFFAMSMILSHRLQRQYGVFLSPKTNFHSSLVLRHPTSIIIGEGVTLGENVVIFQNVTLGRSSSEITAYPSVDDDTIIYAGAIIIGAVKIGKNCIIGANAVVTQDIPDGCSAVGVPAKIISRK